MVADVADTVLLVVLAVLVTLVLAGGVEEVVEGEAELADAPSDVRFSDDIQYTTKQ